MSNDGHVPENTFVALAANELSPEERAAAFDHIVACAECRRIWKGVAAFDELAQAEGLAPERPASRSAAAAAAAWLGLAAAVVLAVAGVWLYQQSRRERDQIATAPAAPAAPANRTAPPAPGAPGTPGAWLTAFSLVKADIHVLPSDAFRVRGKTPAGGVPVEELAKALEPYRRDDYEAAATALTALVQKYPQSDRPNLYVGVSRLFLDRVSEAIPPLEIAKRSSVPAIARDAQWYLAVARAKLGQPEAALAEVDSLCSTDPQDVRACAARDALRAR